MKGAEGARRRMHPPEVPARVTFGYRPQYRLLDAMAEMAREYRP